MSFPDHREVLDASYGPGTIQALLSRCFWQAARSVEEVAPHQYCVRGWSRDKLPVEDFDSLVQVIKTHGRREQWTPPEDFYDSGSRRPHRNHYLYPGDGFAYWVSSSRDARMLNREHVSVQQADPTRRVIDVNKRLF